jgi:histidinol-phosphate phosphatase family protein
VNSKLALLDRDGTLIEHVHYLADPHQVRLLPGTGEGLQQLKQRGYKLVMVSNQSGVGRGYFTQDRVEAVNRRLQELLADAGAQLDLLLYCPHAPEARCACRKPQPGMAEQACRHFQTTLRGALVVGDSDCDMELATRLNLPGYRLGSDLLPRLDLLAALLDQT